MSKQHYALRPFWDLSRLSLTPFFDDEEAWDLLEASYPSGLSIYEGEREFCVEAALPGLKQEEVEIHYDEGYLMIRGQKREEKQEKKYFRRASKAFSYRVAVPPYVDHQKAPEATFKDGVVTVVFVKTNGKKKSIPIRSS